MSIKIEHANICVKNIDGIISFLQTAFPEFKIRHDGIDSTGNRWVHIGTDSIYFELEQSTKKSNQKWVPYSGHAGINHIVFEVDDVEDIRNRLLASGFIDSTIPNNHPFRKRIYFHDVEGNNREFVQYLSDENFERNDYKL